MVGDTLIEFLEPHAPSWPCLLQFLVILGQHNDYSDGSTTMDARVISPMGEGSECWGDGRLGLVEVGVVAVVTRVCG